MKSLNINVYMLVKYSENVWHHAKWLDKQGDKKSKCMVLFFVFKFSHVTVHVPQSKETTIN